MFNIMNRTEERDIIDVAVAQLNKQTNLKAEFALTEIHAVKNTPKALAGQLILPITQTTINIESDISTS